MTDTAKSFALLACMAVLAFGLFFLRGCIREGKEDLRESGRAQVAATIREAAHNATIAQSVRNNDAATRWRDLEQVISGEFEPFYHAVQSAPSAPPGQIRLSSDQAPTAATDCGLDGLVPLAVERDLRLRVAQSNDAICARGNRGATATCAAWAEARAAFLSASGTLTWRGLVLFTGRCMEVIALSDNDKSAVLHSLGERESK